MSGQAKRSRILAAQRKRRRVAMAIASLERGGKPRAFSIERGELTFDVHRARAHAESLVVLDDEHDAFTDWTMDQGLGPDNREPGAFASDGWWCVDCDKFTRPAWFGDCSHCGDDGALTRRFRHGGWPGKLAREWPGDRRAPMGRRLAQLGRDILAALEGQPGGCQGLGCRDQVDNGPGRVLGFTGWKDCQDCRGTGHNLHGTLPAIEWSAQVRRKAHDSMGANMAGSWESWPHMLQIEQPANSLTWAHPTRVEPRGVWS